MDIHPEDETSYTTQFQEAILQYVECEYCANHRCMLATQPEGVLNNNLVSSAMASRSGQSSYAPYNLSIDNEEYFMPKDVAETTPGRSDCAAHLLTAAMLYLNSTPLLPQNWGQVNPCLNDYHSNPMVISSTF